MSLPTNTKTRFGYARQYPFDLALISIAAVAAYLLVTTLPFGSAARLVITLPLVLFLPGYALVTVLFPAKARVAREQASAAAQLRPGGIDTVERLGLSFALSLAIVPMVVLALGPTEWHLTTESTAAGIAIVTVVLAQLGAIRRLRVPEPDRYAVSFRSGLARIRGNSSESEGAIGTLSTVALALGIVAAGLALTVALVAPQPTAGFTEFGLLTEDEDGELVTDAPSAVGPGESLPVVLTVDNQEDETMEYTVVAQQQRLEGDEVVERTELDAFDARIEAGESERLEREVTPTVDNGTVRVTFLLFEGEPPAEPTRNDSMEDVYFWVTVSEDATDTEETAGTDGSDEANDTESDGEDAAGNETVDDESGGEDAGGDGEGDDEDAGGEDESDGEDADGSDGEGEGDESGGADDGSDDGAGDDADDDESVLDGFFDDEEDDGGDGDEGSDGDDGGEDDSDDADDEDDDSGFTISVGSDDDE